MLLLLLLLLVAVCHYSICLRPWPATTATNTVLLLQLLLVGWWGTRPC
jgi:hypothetical protein